jgi:hypothetical protein
MQWLKTPGENMSKMNGTSKGSRNDKAAQPAPKNARVVKSSAKTGTVSRSAARSAAKEISNKRS